MVEPQHPPLPQSIEDLRSAPFNPRQIDADALVGLEASLESFGDISGICWNRRTGHLVAGHQRLAALRQRYGVELRVEHQDGEAVIVTPKGERFPIRVVDWDELTEKAANLAANNRALEGRFTEGALPLLEELGRERPALFDATFLGAIADQIEQPDQPTGLTPIDTTALPTMAWVLVGIPSVRFGEIAGVVEQLATIEGVICETAVTS